MQKSVLTEIMRSIDRKEIREIQKWLHSPAHNQRQDVLRLFEYLTKNLNSSDTILEKEQAWRFVFPGDPYDDAYMRQVMYFLLKSIEEYLVFADYTNDRVQFQAALTRIYRERKLEKAHKQAHRLARESLENQPFRNGYFLRQHFFLEQEEYEYRMSISQNALVNLQEVSDALEKWFLSEKIRISCEMLAHRSVYQKAVYDEGLLEGALQYTTKKNFLEEPAIAVFYYAYKAIKNPEEEVYFDQLENLIHHQAAKFTHSESQSLYLAALNYCVGKVNRGQFDFARRLFELYKKGIATGILLENDTVSRYTFGNAVGSALRLREFGWAEKFIQDFQHHLDEKERNSIVKFNLSRVYFEKGDYKKAQQLLTQFDYDDMLLNIIAKTMLLKIYFEQDEMDAFESLLESMRIYLQRKEALDPARKTAYKNMISLMKKLLNLNPYSKTQKAKLREMIEATTPLMEREWLLKQVDGK